MILTQKKNSAFENPNEYLVFKSKSFDLAIGLMYDPNTIFTIFSTLDPYANRFRIETFDDFEIISPLSEIFKTDILINKNYLEGRLKDEGKHLMDIVVNNFEKYIGEQNYLFVNKREDGENDWFRKLTFVQLNKNEPFSRDLYRVTVGSNRKVSEPYFHQSNTPDTFLYHLESTLNGFGTIYNGKNINRYLNRIGFNWIYQNAKKQFKRGEYNTQEEYLMDGLNSNIIYFPNRKN